MRPFFYITSLFLLFSCNKQKNKSYTCTCDIHGATYTRETKEIKAKTPYDAGKQCQDFGASVANGAHFECSTQ